VVDHVIVDDVLVDDVGQDPAGAGPHTCSTTISAARPFSAAQNRR
jgi:hypothetical protein